MQAKLKLPSVNHFFDTLKSERRLALCAEANTQLGPVPMVVGLQPQCGMRFPGELAAQISGFL
jgi:hypothetical protein